MYNMDISIFGFKISVEILILVGIIYLILIVHTVCSCCNMPSIMEALSGMDSDSINESTPQVKSKKSTTTEGFTGANTNYGLSSPYDLSSDIPLDTSNWSQPNLTVTNGEHLSKGVQSILNRPEQPIPLPEGEMLMFANTEFKPECCPSTFSTSTGCACITTGQYNYLVQRGGNNVPYSEY